MQRHHIPTARFRTFASNQFDQAVEYVRSCGFDVVLKASGLAAGKGVLIPKTVDEAIAGLKEIMVDNVFGAAGRRPSGSCKLRVNENSFSLLRQRSRCGGALDWS